MSDKNKPAEDALVNISQLAEQFEMDRATVRKRLKDLPPAQVKGREKLYPRRDAEAVLSAAENPGLDEAKRRKASIEAELLELKLRRERGDLLDVKEVRSELQEIFKRLHQYFCVHYPAEAAARLYKAESPAQIAEILQRDFGRTFNDFRGDYKSFL